MQLSRKQKEYIRNATHRYNWKIGAVRSGKSFVDTAFMIPWRMRQVTDKAGLVVFFGVSAGTIERNILEPMREIYGNSLVGNIRTGKGTAMVFGEEVWCIGTEKVSSLSKIQGVSIKYAYGDEVAKWNQDVFSMIESRLDKPYSCMDGACNPEGPNHWFKKWLEKPGLDLYTQHYVIFDNPFLPKEFVENLCKEYEGTVYYQRYILGKWALAEGLIYPMYEDAIEAAPAGAKFTKYAVSVDYGTENAFAAILWAYCDDNHVWYARKEYYYSGRDTGIPKTDDEYVDDMKDFTAETRQILEDDYKRDLATGDPYVTRRKLTVIVDPSAASFITALQKTKLFKVQKADNDVENGIRDTAVAIKQGYIKIDPGMVCWKDEAAGYIWDPKAAESGVDKPVKIKDHEMDATRYGVRSLRIVQKGRKNAL